MTKKNVRKGSDREAIYYCVKKQNNIPVARSECHLYV